MYQRYLDKHTFRPKLIAALPQNNTSLIVVIPVYDEESVLLPLKDLQVCEATSSVVEVILVFNASEVEQDAVVKKNIACKEEAENWFAALKSPRFRLHCIEENSLPKKHAGVGLARKIGMDEAVRRFHEIKEKEGIIICFDADSACDSNYLSAIETHFKNNPKSPACSIYYEHPLNSTGFSEFINRGITFYELHLRYYKNGLTYAKLPYDFHTVGSSMAVRATAYCQEGGMNRRKAGEDFYFLQKFIKQGNFTTLNHTRVIPSPRTSNRVPFGTGRAIQEMVEGKRNVENTYAFDSFELLRETFEEVESWYDELPKLPSPFVDFVGMEKLTNKVAEIRQQSTTVESFVKRLFHWFDAFQTLKFMHYLRDYCFPQESLIDASSKLLAALNINNKAEGEADLLLLFRKIDRKDK